MTRKWFLLLRGERGRKREGTRRWFHQGTEKKECVLRPSRAKLHQCVSVFSANQCYTLTYRKGHFIFINLTLIKCYFK